MHFIAYGKAMRVHVHPLVLCSRSKIGLAMRLTATLLLGICLHVSAGTMSQQVTLSEKNTPLQTIFKKIRSQTGYSFVYRSDWMQESTAVSINVEKASLWAVLDICFKDQPFTWEVVRNTIVLRRKLVVAANAPPAAPVPPATIKGKVQDEKGVPVVGASVLIKGTKKGVVTGADGSFTLEAESDNVTLIISYVGFETKTIRVKGSGPVAVTLAPAAMQDMVVTGIMNRRKESFTGAAVSFNNAQLKAIGNQNVIQSLRTLDPSFILTENSLKGSNPNILPQIEIRGKTAISSNSLRSEFSSDPNQPLFIMDGFEVNLRTIVDLDINRVESVTLLKDAASTAIYGARAANGVVVIETRKPKPGRMQLYYSGDFKMEIPDLSVYNLMNAQEKLEFERLSGRYTVYEDAMIEEQFYYDSLYASRLQRVKKGVNTYWLNEPVRLGFTHGHSIRAEGGDNNIVYAAGLQFKQNDGVMKGSGRKTWQGNVDLTYRKGKLNVTNKLFVNGYTATESPYGSFADYVAANPYYEKYNATGGVDKYLEVSRKRTYLHYETVVNPLWNASLPSINENKGLDVQNNFQLNYQFTPDLAFTSGLWLTKGGTDGVVYYAPEHTMFDEAGLFEKGSYTSQRQNSLSYQTNAMLTYGRLFGGLHQVTVNARAEAQETKFEMISNKAVGFPPGTNGNPAFAYGYDLYGRPATAYSQFRRNSFLLSGSYTYDRRFVFDFSARLDGTTAFGSNEKYSRFWHIGGAWNLHQERAFMNRKWVNTLRLKANTGSTGNQNFDQVTSVSVYTFEQSLNLFGQGLSLTTLGNPNLGWQYTQQTNLGVDFTLFGGKLGGFVNLYEKYTNPLVVAVDLPPSTGLYQFPKNVGYQDNRGIEANIRYSPIYKNRRDMTWNIGFTGIVQKAKYGGLDKALESLNKLEQEDKSLIRFYDGASPDDLWAVYSYGIDPASGREVFLKKDGTLTYEYNGSDQRVVGNSRPTVEGVLNTSFMWKGFSVSVALRYRVGGDAFNDALYQKVENISDDNVFKNQDKRALYDRWKKPGDMARFKAISITATTPKSSRFVQPDNTLIGESMRVGYDFPASHPIIKRLGMRTLSVNAYLNDIFRISTIRQERGIEYPFARIISFSINTSF